MDERIDRLYDLMPVVYRLRDAEQGYPLKALLRVIAEQVNVVEDDIAQLYDNWFIETAQDWAVPYLGELVGYRLAHEAGAPGDVNSAQGRARNKILIPRRDVANTIRNRRRKGALALLELLANDVAGWPARAVEFFKLLGWTQNLNHLQMEGERARTVNLRNEDALDLLNGPFDSLAHSIDTRRIDSPQSPGRYNIPSVGLFVWRLRPYTVSKTPALCLEEEGPQCYTFSVLGQDIPLFVQPVPEPTAPHNADEMNVPAEIRQRAFELHKEKFYGEGKSLAIWASGWASHDANQPLPARVIIPADLSNWQYQPPRNRVAVDPVHGRIAFPPSQLPKRGVRVSYVYGFSAEIGGGEYDRPLVQPAAHKLYRVGEDEPYRHIADALKQWQDDKQQAQPKSEDDATERARKQQEQQMAAHAVIEIADSGVYVEPLDIALAEDESLQLRAANRARPVIRLIDWQTDLPDSLRVTMARGSRITLDGLLITGRAVHIRGAKPEKQHKEQAASAKGNDAPAQPEAGQRPSNEVCPAEVNIRHCTLVPGWGLDKDCEPKRPAEPSLELFDVHARVQITHSIIGSIQVNANEVRTDPLPMQISDSILDAMNETNEALGAPGYPVAHVALTIQRCTVFGIVQVHAIALAENCIFNHCVNVARRQLGCMRFCYVPHGCRTPRRYNCQPDLAERAAAAEARRLNSSAAQAEIDAAQKRARQRVQPQFNASRYGMPAYAQLAESCADEIKRGADDESELGAFHDLFQPQREANLRARLSEYIPAAMQAAILYAN